MKRSSVFAILAAGILSAASSASAGETLATLSNIQSPVMVNQGDAYVAAREGMKLGSGDQVLVMQGGAVVVNYTTGCELTLGSNEMLRVAATETCSSPLVAAATSAGGIDPGLVATLAATGWAAYEIIDDSDLGAISR